MKGKTCLVTGSNAGIGKETAKVLAKQGAEILMICRNSEKGHMARQEIMEFSGHANVHLFLADLSSQKAIRTVCEEIRQHCSRLDVLVNNAGFMGYMERTETENGIEATFAVNHLAYFMIANLLADLVKAAPKGRIVNVSSIVHKFGEFDTANLELQTGYKPFKAYCNTKFFNVLFTREMAKRLEPFGVTVNCLDPGKVYTQISKTYPKWFRILHKIGKPFLLNARQGAKTSIYLASSDEVSNTTGEYFAKQKIAKSADHSRNEEWMKMLWAISEDYTGMKGQTV